MKRKLLLLIFVCTYGLGNVFADADPAVVFFIYPPSGATGNYSNDYAVVSQSWTVPDMLDPANAIIGDLVIAFDATDSLICDPPVITDVDGKIAVLWRGACEFGAKALACQDAGAIAVVIVNHSGEPVGMGGGVEGINVTIPTVMVSTSTGGIISDAIGNGETLTIFHGNKTGFYGNDIGIKPELAIKAAQFSSILLLSQDETEFDIPLGAWITNFGSNDQTGVLLSAEISLDGSELYNETAGTSIDIASGDSAFVMLPVFSQTSYEAAIYDMTYTVVSDSIDEFDADNSESPNFAFSESLFTYSSFTDEANGPTNLSFSQPSGMSFEAQHCIHFSDANASRVVATGMTFALSTNAETIDGEVADIFLYEWTLEFEDILDDNFDQLDDIDLDLLSSGFYEYVGGDLEGENVFAEFEDIIDLDDDSRYLFCVRYENSEMFLGHDAAKNAYQATQDEFLQPLFSISSDEEWNVAGFGANTVPGIAVHMINANAVSVEEVSNNVDVTPYPNPAQNFIQIPFNDVSGLASINVFDISGKLVETIVVSINSGETLKFDVSNLENGMYTFGLRYEDGNVSNFNVVINK